LTIHLKVIKNAIIKIITYVQNKDFNLNTMLMILNMTFCKILELEKPLKYHFLVMPFLKHANVQQSKRKFVLVYVIKLFVKSHKLGMKQSTIKTNDHMTKVKKILT
jgi:hypothetical protein